MEFIHRARRGLRAARPASVLLAISWTTGDPVPARAQEGEGRPDNSASGILRRLPIAFVENRGQWEGPAKYLARRGGMLAWIEKDAFTLQLERRVGEVRIEGIAIRLVLEGALESLVLEGEGEGAGIHNFFLGNDPSMWRVDVPGYASVVYRGVQAGVDLRVREEKGRLEYDLVLAPEADLGRIAVRCEGIRDLVAEPDGSLAMGTALGPIRQSPPLTWYALPGGERKFTEGRFRPLGPNRFGFEVPGRDPSLALVIDPGLLFSTYLGAASFDSGTAVALDAAGAATVAGRTRSPGFPTTLGAYDTTSDGGYDVFVARLSASGTALLSSTFLGGSGGDFVEAIALDSAGSPALSGSTFSPDFATTPGAYDTTFGGLVGTSDAFVARLSPTGDALLSSSFLGGTFSEVAEALALDGGGGAVVAGTTNSPDFPATSGSYDTTQGGLFDAFVSRLSPSGSALLQSTFLGGSEVDVANALALDTAGAATIAGSTTSPGFPTTAGAFGTSHGGGSPYGDAFVARVSSSGNALLYSTFLGGAFNDVAENLALDVSGAATVGGRTETSAFPTTVGAFDTTFNGGLEDGFVARLSASGGSLLYSTLLGGSSTESAGSLALDTSGAATVAGATYSTDFPTSAGAFDTTFDTPGGNLFVARLSPTGGAILYSTLAGRISTGPALALDAAGAATVAGQTSVADFPTTPGAYDTTYDGGEDAVVARFDLLPAGAVAYGASTPGCSGPLAIGVTSWPQVGNAAFALTCTNAPANSPGSLGVSLGPASPLLFLAGVLVAIDPLAAIVLGAASDPFGAATVAIPIPGDPLLVGGEAYAQFFWLDPCAPGGISGSNALALTLQP